MTIQVYNTLTRTKEEFKPLNGKNVNFYVCGPTVYNYIHIGNARSAVAFDTIRRYLEYRGYLVKYVSNFTDVDDKIIKAAKEENLSPKQLADKYIAAYQEDTGAINVRPADIHPRVIDHISEIITFVEELIRKGYAYESDGDVYYRAEKFEDYGKLSHQSLNDLVVGASQRTNDEEIMRKENPIDFALWKRAKPDELAWESPWSVGRPGWHIECSVMSTKYLGNTLDIHGGGQDLEFPHHENEIAQSEAHNDQLFAKYWLHNGFVVFGQDGEKMSKSLGNFVLLRDLLKEEDPMVIRYLLATVHYRRPLRYDQDTLTDARNNISRLKEVLRRLNYHIQLTNIKETNLTLQWEQALEQYEKEFQQAMDDDFNTANAMTAISHLAKDINRYLTQDEMDKTYLWAMKNLLIKLLDILGIDLVESTNQEEVDWIEAMIEKRNQARAAKDYTQSDAIRAELFNKGIQLDDTPQGTTWKRVNNE